MDSITPRNKAKRMEKGKNSPGDKALPHFIVYPAVNLTLLGAGSEEAVPKREIMPTKKSAIYATMQFEISIFVSVSVRDRSMFGRRSLFLTHK